MASRDGRPKRYGDLTAAVEACVGAFAARPVQPLCSPDSADPPLPYDDLASAILRGRLPAERRKQPEALPLVQVQDYYRVRTGLWEEMVGDLLTQITLDAGSMRKAAEAIGMPRSTLSAKLKRYRERQS